MVTTIGSGVVVVVVVALNVENINDLEDIRRVQSLWFRL